MQVLIVWCFEIKSVENMFGRDVARLVYCVEVSENLKILRKTRRMSLGDMLATWCHFNLLVFDYRSTNY